VSILNLQIYLAIVKAGKMEVTNSLHGLRDNCQVELMRRNISTGASSSSDNRSSKTQFCEMKTEAMTEGNTIFMTRIVTHNDHKHSDASINISDVDEVSADDCVLFF
jgi:hypothetical protein